MRSFIVFSVKVMLKVNQGNTQNYLRGSRVYLSGPMGFVRSRSDEKNNGWRSRLKQFLDHYEAVVFDPWMKPDILGCQKLEFEDEQFQKVRDRWSFEQNRQGAESRAFCSQVFMPALKSDLRMVDISDFTIAFCPTNIYSVGTVHEIIRCREQCKPVLLVSPHVDASAFDQLRDHLKDDRLALQLLHEAMGQLQIQMNPDAIPSCWYMALVDTEQVFDGFGFAFYMNEFKWTKSLLDDQETRWPPKNALLPYLARLNSDIPKRWDQKTKEYIENSEWMLWDLREPRSKQE